MQLGKDIINGIISGLSSLAGNLWSKIKSIASSAKDEASNVKFDEVGKGWMDGLAAGIEAGNSVVNNTAAETARKVYSTTKQVFRENSPSKRAMELGRWWSEGLAVGIEDGAGAIYGVLNDMGTSMDARMYDAVSPMAASANASAVGTASALNSQGVVITNNITVDGAEDPESFASRLVRQLQLDMRAI